MIDRMIVAVLLGLLSLTYGLQCPKQKTSPGREVVCYTSVSDVDQLTNAVCRCTTLVQQGHDVRNLSVSDLESFRQSLKEINPALQFVVSVDDPSNVIRTSGTIRQEATARLIGILKEADGVELNMTAGSRERLVHFVKGLKDELVRKSYDKRIFLVLPTKSEELAKQFHLKELSKYVDLFTIPTHYLVEDDEAYRTFHPSRLMGLFDMYNADSLIDLISGLGAPKRKILVSVPASAYRFTLKDQDDNAPRSPTEEMQPVIIDQKQLCDSMSKDLWTVERDEDLTAPYAFKNKTWIAFEDKISLGIKGKYALVRELPGLAIRDIENDFGTRCGKPLTHEIHHSFTNFKRKSRGAVLNALEDDLHQTQLSYPTEVKSSEFRVVRVVDTEGHIRAVRENTQTEFTCSRQGYFVHPKSCNRFYRCVKFNQEVEDYSVFEFDCPAGLSFDERTEVCVWPGSLPEGSPCPGSSEIAPVARVRFECPSKSGYYADPQNPRWFFACIDLGGPEMMAYEFRCPYGLIFDENRLVCEWPWLVPGYSDSAYTRAEYDNRAYGGHITQGIGGYYTGGLPHGYSGATGSQGGVYTGTTASIGNSGIGSTVTSEGFTGHHGFSGAADVGYSGSTIGSHGTSFEQGSTGTGYSGIGTGGRSGSTVIKTGQIGGGSIGSGYTGYSGSTSGVYTGSGGSKYSGTTGAGQASIDSGFTGSGSTVGTGGVYSGSAGTDFTGSTHLGGSGSTVIKTGQIGGGSIGSGYTGYSGSTSGVYTGSGGIKYSGTTGTDQVSIDSGYTGTGSTIGTGGVYSGSAGTDYTGSAHLGGSGLSTASGNEYQGSSFLGHNTGSGYTGTASSAHAGVTGTSYTGSVAGGHAGSTGTGYTVSVAGAHSGSTIGGHAGSTGTSYTGGYAGSSSEGYLGSTSSGIHGGSAGTSHVGSGVGGFTGTTGVHGGSTGTIYSGGSTRGGVGYAGTATGAHGGSTGTIYSGGSTNGGVGYTGSTGGGYSGQTSGVHGGSIGTGYSGSTGGTLTGGSHVITDTGYSGSTVAPGYTIGDGESGTKGGYSGSSGVQYIGSSHGATLSGVDYSRTTVPGASGDGYSVQTGTHIGSGLDAQSGISTKPHIPIYASGGTTGTGISSLGSHGQTFGTTYVGKPEGPSVDCASNQPPSYCRETTQEGDQTYLTGGYTPEHSVPSGLSGVFPGQSGVTTTYFGKAGTKSYGQGVVTSGASVYPDGSGYISPFKGAGDKGSLNITLIGSGTPSVGSKTYYGTGTSGIGYGITGSADTGAIVTGSNVPGSIVTGDSSPGTIITYGQTPGTIVSGSSGQASIVTSGSQTGYIKSGPSTPGYVVSGGVKTVYTGSASPGTVVFGPSSSGVTLTGAGQPGTVIKGESTPGIVVTGQTAPGVSISGPSEQGTIIGSGHTGPTYVTKIGQVPYGNEYKTNEYYDNGGRGTIKFNNGAVTTKYTENDIPDYRPAGGIIPAGSLFPGSTVGGPGASTPSGFTKTGPTKTGLTTATLGGRGTYVIGTGKTSITSDVDKIGEKAFEGNVAGIPKSSTESSLSVNTGATSIPSHDTSYVDTSKITLGSSKTTGYSYPKPSIPFGVGVTTPTAIPISPTEGSILTAATPTPFLNVEVYKSPNIVGSTVSPAVVNTYGSADGAYQSKIPTGFSRVPSSTVSPVLYTTGPLENYKTTVFEAVKLPTVISTVHPVIDTGYKTVVSSTSIPVTISHDKFGGNIQTGSVSTQAQFDFGTKTSQSSKYDGKDYVSSTTPSSIFGASSTYSPVKPRPFSPSISVPFVTEQPEINYVSSTLTGSDYIDSKSSFGHVTSSSVSESLKPQTQYLPHGSISPAIGVTYGKPFPLPDITYQQSTPVAPAIQTGGSPTNVAISRDEVGKLITNYNRGSTKYAPSKYDVYTPGSITGGDFTGQQSSLGQTHGSSTPLPFGKTQSLFTGGYSKPSSVVTYQTTAKTTAVGNAKVIVKWSDLHPLLLGKLSAECTCRGDPFANLRGPGAKLINSSKGKVNLANYDESEIYVDLEKDGSYEDDYVTSYESSSRGPIKIWNNETPVPTVLDSGVSQVRQKPLPTYLPNVTPSANAALRGSVTGFSQNVLGSASNLGFSTNYRFAKSLSSVESSTNLVGSQGASFDRFGPGGLANSEETLEGATNCARPGLFRHPNFCNKFYACHWDEWKKKFTLHVFNCPVHLTFDSDAGACNWPSMGPACQDDNLLV